MTAIRPSDPAADGLSGADHAWVARRQTPQPGHACVTPLGFDPGRVASVPRTFVDCTAPPLATIDVARGRVRDPDIWNGAWSGARERAGWNLRRIMTPWSAHQPPSRKS